MPVRFDDLSLFFDEANTTWLLSAVGMKSYASMSTLMSFWAVVVFTLSIGCFTTKDVLARMITTNERRQKISKKLAKMILGSSPSVHVFLEPVSTHEPTTPVKEDQDSHHGEGIGGAPTTPAPTPTPPHTKKPKNILFLIADDLRPQLNKAYGKTFMHTPHLDRFTDTALVFDWAYTNHGICGASRNSFLSGRVPDKTRVWNFLNDFRQTSTGKNWTSLPQFFKNHGYNTIGLGKLYHPGRPYNNDMPLSWTSYPSDSTNSRCGGGKYHDADGISAHHQFDDPEPSHGGGNFCPDGSSAPNQFSDVNVTKIAVATLQQITATASETPWFLGLGWHYPHQPWHVPLDFVDLYPNPVTGLEAPTHPYSPIGMPDVAFNTLMDGHESMSLNLSLPGFLNSRPAGVNGTVEYIMPRPGNNTFPEWFTQQIRVGYYSAVSHMDANFGSILDALEASGAANDTIVVFAGDHGWQLGEHTSYAKQTNFELSTHVPLLIRDPSKAATSAGKHASNTKAELVDLYRTLVALSGLSVADIETDVDGVDLSEVLEDTSLNLRNYAFSQYARCPGKARWRRPPPQIGPDWFMNICSQVPAQNITFMGYTVRSSDYRYTMWFPFNGTTCEPEWDAQLRGEELYSHVGQTDPGNFDDYENINLIEDPNPMYAPIIEEHRTVLLQNFRGKDKRVAGCPPSVYDNEDLYLPLEDNALILEYSEMAQNTGMCGHAFCSSSYHPNDNYVAVSIEGYMPSPSQAIGADRADLKLYWNNAAHNTLISTEISDDKVPVGYIEADVVVGTVLKERAAHGTVAMYVYYNQERQDYLTCASKKSLSFAMNQNYTRIDDTPIGFLYVHPEWSEEMY